MEISVSTCRRQFNKKEILDLLLKGFRDEQWKDELRQIEERRRELQAVVEAAKDGAATPGARSPNE